MTVYHYHKEHQEVLATFRDRIRDAVYKPIADLRADAWVTPEPVEFTKKKTGRKKSLQVGKKWGKLWDCAWIKITGKVPAAAKGKKVVIRIDVSGEACVFDDAGNPVQGLTTKILRHSPFLEYPGKCVYRFLKNDNAKGGEKIGFWIEAGCNDLFGGFQGGILAECCLSEFNPQMNELFYDYAVLFELLGTLDKRRARYHTILKALTDAGMLMKDYNEAEAKKALKILAPEMAKRGASPASFNIAAVGHAHMDLAWLWPIRETKRKGCRTFSTALKMMERYPDYKFCASQPQLYQWMKELYPAMYKNIKRRVAQGRWDTVGAMWVECDVNITSGESLVRQVLYGKRFFIKEFGIDTKVCFLPDCFGFTAALPQILKKAGVDYFLTHKTTWAKFIEYPHDTFHWQGIDGSKVLAHTPPSESYSSSAAPASIAKYEERFKDKMVCPELLLLFGLGDGGGGAGEEHLEALLREKNLDGLPPVRQKRVEEFFEFIAPYQDDFSTWVGPIDLDRHTGTFTTQARSKRYNRKLEIALRSLELTATAAMLRNKKYEYPKARLDKIWKEMLLYQFHDILPGTSITRVHKESRARYAKMLAEVTELTAKARQTLYGKPTSKNKMLVSNDLSWERTEWQKVAGQWQKVTVASMACVVVDNRQSVSRFPQVKGTKDSLENNLLQIRFAPDGSIATIYDKQHNCRVIEKNKPANRLAVYVDELNNEPPTNRDKDSSLCWGYENAWDFPIHYRRYPIEYFILKSSKFIKDGPQAIMRQRYVYGKSTLTQDIVITQDSKRIDFVTKVAWKERRKMLRTSFPVTVKSDHARCEIQFGNVKRNTHKNTNWDYSKFESPAHKWVDLSRDDYGVALLNDCKYGYQLFDNVLDLNLLRSTGYPDPVADIGKHEFTYSLLPHVGDYIDGKVVKAGYELNMPLELTPATSKTKGSASLITVDSEHVIVEAVKKAEDSEDIIVRLYECHSTKVKLKISFGFDVKSAVLVDLMERNLSNLRVKNNSVTVELNPFEIYTIKLRP
ncbi:MAG: alpha-mannosidase [Planctomycetota bacterium]|nr:MAG: alpha-mannosidase [Planctomycetota bacterium]